MNLARSSCTDPSGSSGQQKAFVGDYQWILDTRFATSGLNTQARKWATNVARNFAIKGPSIIQHRRCPLEESVACPGERKNNWAKVNGADGSKQADESSFGHTKLVR